MDTKQLLEQIDKLSEINAVKNNYECKKDLDAVRHRVANNTFRIAVAGEFSSGKSTFINALIGEDLLTHAVNETTAAITRVCNVEKNDARLGTCEITYHDGKKITIANMAELYGYTTVQSAKNVADTISNVSVYVHFSDVTYPIEIVDTPGLNGIADKHREITIEEIKRAHACIYLLPVKGVTHSDADFIQILQRYQSKFIFVQNFIDQLNLSEGETAESKIEADKNLINEIFGDNGISIDYEICGISALKRLCAKDATIKRLYRDDLNELTSEDRQRLDAESLFCNFEKLLAKLTADERYKEIIIDSAIQALNALIDRTLPVIVKKQEINAELRKQDDMTKRIEKSRQLISRIESGKEDHRRKLKNFIISRDKENRDGLKEYAGSRLRDIYQTICEEIDERIRDYEALEEFEWVEKKTMPEFYGKRTESLLNSEVIPDLDERIEDNLSHLYDEALERVSGYTINFSGPIEAIDFKIEGRQESFRMNDGDFRIRIKQYQSERKRKENESRGIEAKIKNQEQKLNETSVGLKIAKQEKQRDIQEIDREIKALGKKPEVKQTTITKSKRVKRGGFLGGIADFFDDGKMVYYDEVAIDDSAQREWIRMYDRYMRKRQQDMERHEQKISKLRSEQSSLEGSIKRNETRYSQIQGDIRHLEERIKRETEIYETFLKQHKREFCESQKSKLKNLLQSQLFDRGNKKCTLERLIYHIDHMSDRYMERICKNVDRYYVNSVEKQMESLRELIGENTQKLEEQYNVNARDIDALNTIRNLLKENKR